MKYFLAKYTIYTEYGNEVNYKLIESEFLFQAEDKISTWLKEKFPDNGYTFLVERALE